MVHVGHVVYCRAPTPSSGHGRYVPIGLAAFSVHHGSRGTELTAQVIGPMSRPYMLYRIHQNQTHKIGASSTQSHGDVISHPYCHNSDKHLLSCFAKNGDAWVSCLRISRTIRAHCSIGSCTLCFFISKTTQGTGNGFTLLSSPHEEIDGGGHQLVPVRYTSTCAKYYCPSSLVIDVRLVG